VFVVALPDVTTALLTWIAKVVPPLTLPLVIVIAVQATLLLLAAIWWLWWRLPKRQVHGLDIQIHDPKARADTEDNFRKTIGQALGGAAVLIGAAFAYLQFADQQQATHAQLQASHDLLISNQVSKGFEQLASDKIAERLGGIYALEGVMTTSEQYRQPVFEALCAFVRESTTRQKGPVTVLLETLFVAPRDGTAGTNSDKLPIDIQAALTVIIMRKPSDGRVNLEGAKISGADLSGANLSHFNLRGASLFHANLRRAILVSANLSRADLSGASLSNADLSGASLVNADLINAELFNADLTLADLGNANLSRALLGDADLTDADLRDADNLTKEQLSQACGQPKALPWGLSLYRQCPPRKGNF
jgi:uncharacterized protein YjbI with pentapeptide repeats